MKIFHKSLCLVLFTAVHVVITACGSPAAEKTQVFLHGDTATPRPTPQYLYEQGYNSRGWASLPVQLKFEERVPEDIRIAFKNAARTWNEAAGFDLLAFSEDGDAPNYKGDLWGRLEDKVSTIGIENHWCRTKKWGMVLGSTIYNAFPQNNDYMSEADIILNTDYYQFGDANFTEPDGDKLLVDTETIALHELGHLIGLDHLLTRGGGNVMESTLYVGQGGTLRTLSASEKELIRNLYPGGEPGLREDLTSNPVYEGSYTDGFVIENCDSESE